MKFFSREQRNKKNYIITMHEHFGAYSGSLNKLECTEFARQRMEMLLHVIVSISLFFLLDFIIGLITNSLAYYKQEWILYRTNDNSSNSNTNK